MVLADSSYWNGLIDCMRGQLLGEGRLSADDFELIRVADDPAEIVRQATAGFPNLPAELA